jgi:hypothetical protein
MEFNKGVLRPTKCTYIHQGKYVVRRQQGRLPNEGGAIALRMKGSAELDKLNYG